MSQRVLVLGKNYSTPLGVIRSLGKAGFSVDMLYISRKTKEAEILRACKYLDRLIIIDEENDKKVIKALLEESRNRQEKTVIFPTDDYSASFIDRCNPQLQNLFLMPHAIADSVTRLMDKSVQSKLAREIGFQTAREWIVDLSRSPVVLPENIPYPCFVKPLVSAKGGKVGIAKCDNREDLEETIIAMQRRDPQRSVMIQEYLHIIQEYTIGGVCQDQRVFIPAVIRKIQIAQYNKGITLSGVLVENTELADCLDQIYEYLQSVHYVGMFDFEVLLTDKGFYFGEMNYRCGGPSYAYFLGGVNLPAMAVETICARSVPLTVNHDIRYGETFLNLKVAWEDYANLFISKKELKKIIEEKSTTLLTDDADPEPLAVFNSMMPKRYSAFRRKRILKKTVKRFIPKRLIDHYKGR